MMREKRRLFYSYGLNLVHNIFPRFLFSRMSDGKKEKKRKRGKYLTQSEIEEQERRDREFIEHVPSEEERKAILQIRHINSEDKGFANLVAAKNNEWNERLAPNVREDRRRHQMAAIEQKTDDELSGHGTESLGNEGSDFEEEDSSDSDFEDKDELKPYQEHIPAPTPAPEKYSDSDSIEIEVSKKRKDRPASSPQTPPKDDTRRDPPAKKQKVHIVISDDDSMEELDYDENGNYYDRYSDSSDVSVRPAKGAAVINISDESGGEVEKTRIRSKERGVVRRELKKLKSEAEKIQHEFRVARDKKKSYKRRFSVEESRKNNALFDANYAKYKGEMLGLRRRHEILAKKIREKRDYMHAL